MVHFLEALEKELDLNAEYCKLENMIIFENIKTIYFTTTIEKEIEKNFLNWTERGTHTSFREIRKKLGFDYELRKGRLTVEELDDQIGMDKFFLYCEMIYTVTSCVISHFSTSPAEVQKRVNAVRKTIDAIIEKTGFEVRYLDSQFCITEKNAAALEVANLVPELSDVIIEYNNYLLRGNVGRKKELLLMIADCLEPKREGLKKKYKTQTDDFFFLVNKCNIRHNNVTQGNKNYVSAFASLSQNEKEKMYDLIYNQGLLLFMLDNQSDKECIISEFKAKVSS